MKTHCIRGHEFTPENTYMTKSNRRYCRACASIRQRKRRKDKPEEWAAQKARWQVKLRKDVVGGYGGVCVYCGQSAEAYLCLDHVSDDGASHRKEVGNGNSMWVWARMNNYPDRLQLLCHNCNSVKNTRGAAYAQELANG